MTNLPPFLQQLIDDAHLAANPLQRIDHIVSKIVAMMDVPVASFYLANGSGGLKLVASKGLCTDTPREILMQIGDGLIGTIAQTQHPLNLACGKEHPNFHHFPETGEDQYCAFMGVPIIHAGQLVGVLSVERIDCIKFSAFEESLLVTIAAHLGALSPTYFQLFNKRPLTGVDENRTARQWLQGAKGAPGIGIGRIISLSDADELMRHIDTEATDISAEISQLHEAIHAVSEDIIAGKKKLEKNISKDIADIFEIYLMLLQGKQFSKAVEKEIRRGMSAATSLRLAVSSFMAQFESMDDPYFRARAEDIHHLGNQVFSQLRKKDRKTIEEGEKVVLAGNLISISDISSYPREQLAGIISAEGSELAHTAVLAKALGIPAVMGLENFNNPQADSLVIIDGHLGRIQLEPTTAQLEEYQALIAQEELNFEELAKIKELPAETLDGHSIKLLANTGLLSDISPGLKHGAEGIGLYRSEIPFLIHDSFPSETEQIDFYQPVLKAYQGMPVYIRTLDVGGDKPLPYYKITEENSALGWRGIRFSLDNSALFMTQVRAMLRSSEETNNLHIILPMVSNVEEVESFHELLDSALKQLDEEGYTIIRPKVGVMAEVPAITAILPFLKEKIDFVSIGSNDLSQYTLAVDRNNARVSHHFDHLHPAVIHAVEQIVSESKRLHLPVSVCGEMASDIYAVLILIGMGVTQLSMTAFSVPKLKHLIRSISLSETEELFQLVKQSAHTSETRKLIHTFLKDRGLED